MYRGLDLVDQPVTLENEKKFKNLINTIAWALEIENEEEGETTVDLVMSRGTTPDFADEEMKQEYEAQLKKVVAEYEEKVESLLYLFKQEGVPLTLKTMKEGF